MHPGPALPLGLTGHIGFESFPHAYHHAYLAGCVEGMVVCDGAVNTVTTPSDGLG